MSTFASVITNQDGKFWNGSRWVNEYPDAFQGTWPNCVRLARKIPADKWPNQVFIVKDYGSADEVQTEMSREGDIAPEPERWSKR